jgi:AcrR family transcriptional regulator
MVKRGLGRRKKNSQDKSSKFDQGHSHGSIHDPKDIKDTKEKLIQASKSLFSEKGYNGTTVKDIADAARMNVSLVSYHFNGKEGLYRACLEQIGKARLAAAERILQQPQSLEEFRIRFQMFLEEVITVHLEEPEVARIINRECDMAMPVAQDIFKETFLKCYETLINFFKSAQQKGILKKDLQIDILVGFLFGGVLHFVHKDKLAEQHFGLTIKNPKYREGIVQQSVSFCMSCCNKPSSQTLSPSLKERSPI